MGLVFSWVSQLFCISQTFSYLLTDFSSLHYFLFTIWTMLSHAFHNIFPVISHGEPDNLDRIKWITCVIIIPCFNFHINTQPVFQYWASSDIIVVRNLCFHYSFIINVNEWCIIWSINIVLQYNVDNCYANLPHVASCLCQNFNYNCLIIQYFGIRFSNEPNKISIKSQLKSNEYHLAIFIPVGVTQNDAIQGNKC